MFIIGLHFLYSPKSSVNVVSVRENHSLFANLSFQKKYIQGCLYLFADDDLFNNIFLFNVFDRLRLNASQRSKTKFSLKYANHSFRSNSFYCSLIALKSFQSFVIMNACITFLSMIKIQVAMIKRS